MPALSSNFELCVCVCVCACVRAPMFMRRCFVFPCYVFLLCLVVGQPSLGFLCQNVLAKLGVTRARVRVGSVRASQLMSMLCSPVKRWAHVLVGAEDAGRLLPPPPSKCAHRSQVVSLLCCVVLCTSTGSRNEYCVWDGEARGLPPPPGVCSPKGVEVSWR